MVDVVCPDKRPEMTSNVKVRNTKPEIIERQVAKLADWLTSEQE